MGERFRVAAPEDGAAVAAIYGPVVARTVISFEADPPTAPTMAERIAATLETHPWLVAEDERGVSGYAYGGRHSDRAAYRWASNVSVYLREDARGKGLGRRLYERLFAILRAQGYRRLYAGVTLPNPASVGLHEALGFVPVGVYREVGFKFGRWHDVGWWQLPLPGEDPPAEPIPFRDHRRSAALPLD